MLKNHAIAAFRSLSRNLRRNKLFSLINILGLSIGLSASLVIFLIVHHEFSFQPQAHKPTLYGLMIVAVFLLLLGCINFINLTTAQASRRAKEIGIRKILGASVTAIATLLSKDFVKLLAISFVIVTPIAWWAMNQWLDNYAYRAPLSWWIFPLAGMGMMAIALLTMSIRTIRTAMANPVTALRSE